MRLKRQDFTDQPDKILVGDINPEKRGSIRTELYLPKSGPLAPLTEIFEAWLDYVPSNPEAYVFPSARPFGSLNWHNHLDRKRAHQVAEFTTGHFPHFYRELAKQFMASLFFRTTCSSLETSWVQATFALYLLMWLNFPSRTSRFNKAENRTQEQPQ